jgi:hypothetical protein
MTNQKKKALKNSSKILDYRFKEKLSGFRNKSGSLVWDKDRIEDFISSVKNAN